MRPIAATTPTIVVTKKARACSWRRKIVSRYSCSVSTQRPATEIRARSAAGSSSSASEIGWAKGRARRAAAVENQKSDAKEVERTAAGSSSSL